jgi:hypothetical protein
MHFDLRFPLVMSFQSMPPSGGIYLLCVLAELGFSTTYST